MADNSAGSTGRTGLSTWKIAGIAGVGVLAASVLNVSAAIVVGAGLIAYVIYRTRTPVPDARLVGETQSVEPILPSEAVPSAIARHPGYETLEFAVDYYWTSADDFKGLSDKTRATVTQQLLKEGAKILESENPKATNREHLVDSVLRASRLQALIIDPAPNADPTGMRGKYGISGELRAHLVELAHKNEKLSEWLEQFGPMNTFDDVWNPVLVHYWIEMRRGSVLSALRKSLDDWAGRDKPDWVQEYITVEVACAEHDLRKSLALPSNLHSDSVAAGLEWLKMSLFTNCVLEGFENPRAEWERRCADIGKRD